MFIRLTLLLLCISYSGSPPAPVSGIKGRNVILPCNFEDKKIVYIVLTSQTKQIGVCQTEDCSGRVFREGSCDVIIKDLTLRDAGKYFLRVYYHNNQTEVERLILEYQLHIQDEISVNTGEELKLDLLLTNADKVETNSSGEWTEVWTRGHGVRSDRLTDSDGNLTINAFTSNDTGTYRVLDSEGQILITLTLTDSKGNLDDTDEDKTIGTEHRRDWMGPAGLGLALALLLIVVKFWSSLLRDDQVQCFARWRKGGPSSGDPETLGDRGPEEHDVPLTAPRHYRDVTG